MFEIGWTELLVVAIVLILVVGPKDLPRVLRTFGRTMSKVRSMAGEFRSQFDEALKEAELDEVRKTISDAQKLNPTRDLKNSLNPLRKAGEELKADLTRATKADPKKGEAGMAASKEPAGQEGAIASAAAPEIKAPEPAMKLDPAPPKFDSSGSLTTASASTPKEKDAAAKSSPAATAPSEPVAKPAAPRKTGAAKTANGGAKPSSPARGRKAGESTAKPAAPKKTAATRTTTARKPAASRSAKSKGTDT